MFMTRCPTLACQPKESKNQKESKESKNQTCQPSYFFRKKQKRLINAGFYRLVSPLVSPPRADKADKCEVFWFLSFPGADKFEMHFDFGWPARGGSLRRGYIPWPARGESEHPCSCIEPRSPGSDVSLMFRLRIWVVQFTSIFVYLVSQNNQNTSDLELWGQLFPKAPCSQWAWSCFESRSMLFLRIWVVQFT